MFKVPVSIYKYIFVDRKGGTLCINGFAINKSIQGYVIINIIMRICFISNNRYQYIDKRKIDSGYLKPDEIKD